MASNPDDGRNWSGEGPVREEAILSFLREKYHAELMPLTRTFFDFSNLIGLASAPNYETLDIISNETRSALDHLARASVSSDTDEALRNVEFAKWHLDLARIRILIGLSEYIQEILNSAQDYITYRQHGKFDEAFVVERSEVNHTYISILSDVKEEIYPPTDSMNLVIAPTVAEMAIVRRLADDLGDVASRYTQLTARLWEIGDLPSIYELNRWKNRRQLLRRPWTSRTFRGAIIFGLIAASIAASVPLVYSSAFNTLLQILIVTIGIVLGGYRASRV